MSESEEILTLALTARGILDSDSFAEKLTLGRYVVVKYFDQLVSLSSKAEWERQDEHV